jgi:hypothetical protein
VTEPKKCRVVGLPVEASADCPDCASARGDAKPAGGGPAQVATDEYRTGWENVFGKPAPRGQA